MYETLAKHVEFPCIFDSFGCNEKVRFGDVPKHEATCNFREVQCPASDCQEKKCLQMIKAHFVEKHPDLVIENTQFEFPPDEDLPIANILNVDGVSVLLQIRRNSRNASGTYDLALVLLSKTPGTDDFKCALKLTSKENSRLLTVHMPHSDLYRSGWQYPDQTVLSMDIGNLQLLLGSKQISFEVMCDKLSTQYKSDENSSVNLVCNVCEESMGPPIYVCKNGHSICSSCRHKANACPFCLAKYESARNFQLEELTEPKAKRFKSSTSPTTSQDRSSSNFNRPLDAKGPVTKPSKLATAEVQDDNSEPEFPLEDLALLDAKIAGPHPTVLVGKLMNILNISTELAKNNLDTKSEPCQRFFREGLTTSFAMMLMHNSFNTLSETVQPAIHSICLKLIELCVVKLPHDWLCLLDLLARTLNPDTNFQKFNSSKQSKTAPTTSGQSGKVLWARPSGDKRNPRGLLVDLINRFGELNGFQLLLDRFQSGRNLSVPLVFALLRPFGQCYALLTLHTINKYMLPILVKIFDILEKLPDKKLKHDVLNGSESDLLSAIIEWSKKLALRVPNQAEFIRKLEKFRVAITLRRSQMTSKFFHGEIETINKIIGSNKLREIDEAEYLTPERLANRPLPSLSDEDLALVRCSTCNRYLSYAPITVGLDGGSNCGRCTDFVEQPQIKIPMYETSAKYVEFPCIFDSLGCDEKIRFGDVPKHEATCNYREIECPAKDCQERYCVQVIKNHFVGKHPGLVIENARFEFPQDEDLPSVFVLNLNGVDALLQIRPNSSGSSGKHDLVLGVCTRTPGTDSFTYGLKLTSMEHCRSVTIDIPRSGLYQPGWDYTEQDVLVLDAGSLQSLVGSNQVSFEVVCNKTPSQGRSDSGSSINLECNVCAEFMEPPIHICKTGHSICRTCRFKVRVCPSCEAKYDYTRNYQLEELAQRKATVPSRGESAASTTTVLGQNMPSSHEINGPLDARVLHSLKGTLEGIYRCIKELI